ncbi:unnamed protein product, partial [Symbiodinium pilosum]
DHPKHGQDLLTYVFAGMSLWSLLASVVSGFALSSLGARAMYILVAAFALPALVASWTTEETKKSAAEIRSGRDKIFRQKEFFTLACVMCGASMML